MKSVLSSGHGLHISGANHYIDEVTESRKLLTRIIEICDELKHNELIPFNENNAHNSRDNLYNITDFHNRCNRQLDISLHFNAHKPTSNEMGIEILYVSENGKKYAEQLLTNILSKTNFKNRGVKKRTDLHFLNKTNKPSILIELCFVDSLADVNKYKENFNQIAISIAEFICEKEYKHKQKYYRTCTGSFTNIDNAKNEIKKLEQLGLKPFIAEYIKED